jgi:hypothetical protein
MTGRNITIRDVAKIAGVSTATVSRALRGLPHVDAATRDRVARVAEELDYVISPSASRLASGRTGTIAIVTPYVSRWYFATLLSGIDSVLQGAGVDLLLFGVGDPSVSTERIPTERRLRGRVDGLMVLALPATLPEVHNLVGMGLPVSLVGMTASSVPSACIDDVEAARMATQHLLNLGHVDIGLIAGDVSPTAFTMQDDRRRGFASALEGAGLDHDASLEASGYFTVAGGERAMTVLLSQPKRPTAVFAMSDEMAFGAIRALQRHGLRPGRDVSIVGVDGHDISELLDLTTVEQPVAELGRVSAEALLEQLRTGVKPFETTMLPTELVVRGSTVPSAAH